MALTLAEKVKRVEEIRKSAMFGALNLDDKQAAEVVSLYPSMRYDGQLIKVGTRINWNGVIKKAVVDLWDYKENNPDAAPNLWADLDSK